jgi:flagellar biosynthesis/type III secretory pathway M-ring protein FliF/YscJ
MQFLKRYWSTIRVQAEAMSFSAKALIVMSLAVGVTVIATLVWLLSGPEMVPITQFAAGRSEDVLVRLRAADIEASQQGNQVMVPRNLRDDAIAILVQDDLLTENAAAAFNDLIGQASVWQTNRQGDRRYLVAMQRALSTIASKMTGVRRADVVISMPQQQGFGTTATRPSASVTVMLDGGAAVQQPMVQALAGLISGAVAEMTPQDVVVIDAQHGRQHVVRDPQDMVPTDVMDLVRAAEAYHRDKIEQLLRNIPGVVVAVQVQTDPIRRRHEQEYQYQETEPLASETREETVSTDSFAAAEPGARSNVGTSIDAAGGGGTQHRQTRSETRFNTQQPTLTRTSEYSGHRVQQISAAIAVPRSYFANIYQARNPDAEAPDDAAIQGIADQQTQLIRDQVLPLLAAEDTEGIVNVNMVYDAAYLQPQPAAAAAGGPVSALADQGWVSPGNMLTGLMAVAVLGMMFLMVRRATRPETLPSVEELAGLPPTLPTDDDMIGEADEVESALAGVEVDENELQSRRIAEQISDLIRNNPGDAASLLGRWVQADD